MACQIDGRPNASPAWIVKWAFSRRRYSNASRCRIGGKPSSAPAMSKPATPRSRYCDRDLGDLQPALGVPHRREQLTHDDRVPEPGRLLLTLDDALLHGLDGLGERESGRQVLLGRPPQLGVDDAVGGQVDDRLAGDASQVLGPLHHRDGVDEGLEVALERTRARRLLEPRAERLRVAGRQVVADLVGDLDDRGRAYTSVEVLVEGDLGGLGDLFGSGTHRVIVS